MRAVVQRVASASVTVENSLIGRIDRGLLVFVGIERGDGPADVQYIAGKVRDLRVFQDADDPTQHLNHSVRDVGGAVLVVSQFTLAGDCRRGRRPSFDTAAPPQTARPLYEAIIRELQSNGVAVAAGEFQAMMQVALVNDGPVTLLLDSRKHF
jgi:D-tyrosyl-tRNA(Tyr) deacylase